MTDGPDDILRGLLEGDSDGPEATAEQEAFVSGLLGSLRRDDPAMPDDVIRRLDAVLAEERRTGAPVLGVIAGGAGDDALDGPAAPASLPDNVSVLPTAAERRGPSSRSFRLLGGLAAAAVLVVGGATVLNGGLFGGSNGSSDTAGGAGSPALASMVQDSGTAYSSNSLPSQAEGLVAKAAPRSAEGSPESEQPAPSAEVTDAGGTAQPVETQTASADVGPVTPERALLCTAEISDGTVAEPLLVDQGTYDGRDAEIYVLPSVDEPGSYDVIVVAAGCTTGESELLAFRRVAP